MPRAVQITYDPSQITYAELLEVFWKTHNPTTLNRQGPDVGTQYQSAVFYHNDEQRQLASATNVNWTLPGRFHAPIVTQIVPFREFFPAENYHQDYYELNSQATVLQLGYTSQGGEGGKGLSRQAQDSPGRAIYYWRWVVYTNLGW